MFWKCPFDPLEQIPVEVSVWPLLTDMNRKSTLVRHRLDNWWAEEPLLPWDICLPPPGQDLTIGANNKDDCISPRLVAVNQHPKYGGNTNQPRSPSKPSQSPSHQDPSRAGTTNVCGLRKANVHARTYRGTRDWVSGEAIHRPPANGPGFEDKGRQQKTSYPKAHTSY